MNRKDLTKTVMMISNRKKHFDLQGFHKKFSALRAKGLKKVFENVAGESKDSDYKPITPVDPSECQGA